MPYTVQKSDSCPESRPYAVVKKATGEVVACHVSPEAAGKQIGAINHNEKEKHHKDQEKAVQWSERMRALSLAHDVCFGFELIRFGNHELIAEIAERPDQQTVGFKFRTAPRFDAMLFKYDADMNVPFTMSDVAFDLDIFWFDSNKNLIGKTSRSAYDDNPVFPPGDFRYVLEVPSGTSVDGDKLILDDA